MINIDRVQQMVYSFISQSPQMLFIAMLQIYGLIFYVIPHLIFIQLVAQMRQNSFVLGLALLLALASAQTTVIVTPTKNYTSSDTTWLTSPFMRAGQEDVITSYTGSSQFPFSSYTFIYSSPLSGTPNLAYGIQRYRGDDYMMQEYYEIRQTGRTATSFSVEIQIFGVTNLWILAVAYLAVDPSFPHHFNSFDNVPVNYTAGDIVLLGQRQVNVTTQVNDLRYYTNYINYTSQANGRTFSTFTAPFSSNHVVIFMTSLWIRGNGTKPLQFHIYPEVINSSYYMWNVTVWQKVSLTNVHFSEIIFNSDDVESSLQYSIVYQKWLSGPLGGFLPIPSAFVDNFIMGVTAFETVRANCGFEYQWQFANQTYNGTLTFGVQILVSWTLTDTCGFDVGESSILYMMTWRCDPPYDYFNLTTRMCQTACGAYHVEDTVNLVCLPCHPTCYQCLESDPNTCTSCYLDPNRTLVGAKCDCIYGLMEIGLDCLPCEQYNPGCLDCTYAVGGTLPFDVNLFTCTVCNTSGDYFLNGNVCQLCSLSNCLDCSSLTTCVTCAPGYLMSNISQCYTCNTAGCLACSTTPPHPCTNCDTANDYFINGNNCELCSLSNCLDCSSLTTCVSCAPGYLMSSISQCYTCNTPGCLACSTTHPHPCTNCNNTADYFISGNLCALCSLSNCLDCSSLTTCVTCASGYLMSTASQCFSCTMAGCLSCSTTAPHPCLVCNTTMDYFLNGTVCQACSLNFCLDCDNLTACITCQAGYDMSAVLQCFLCNIPGCLNCSIYEITNCTNCDESIGYYNDNTTGQCSSICGDGIVVSADQGCDDNNTINLDGCSSTCSIQLGFTCSGTLSACFYHSSPTFVTYNQSLMDENITCNTITLEFTVVPAALVLQEPYILWDQFLSTPNQSLLWLNTSLTAYTNGVVSFSYFMTGDLQNQTLLFDTNFSALLPNSSMFDNTADLSFSLTISTVPQALMKCCTGFIVNTTTLSCDQICGDGLVFDHPCDDGNLLDGDGCSSSCQIQYDYTCINGTQTTPSVCSFNGTIELALITGDKVPDRNGMVLTYNITSIVPLIKANNDSLDFSQWIQFPDFPGVTVTDAYIDPDTSQLTIKVDYSEDLQDKNLAMNFVAPEYPQAFSIPDTISTWKVQPTNQLKAIVYTEEDYQAARRASVVASIVNGGYLCVMLLAMAYRKWIGLQLATLIQMGYLSLLHIKQITVFAQPITNWRYVFGYNSYYFSEEPSQRFMSPYHIYDYQSFFGFSNNIMLLVVIAVYIVALAFYAASFVAWHKNTVDRLKYVAFLIATDIGYSLVVFLTPNILTALCLELKHGVFFQWTLSWSKLFLIISILLFLFAHTLWVAFIKQSLDFQTYFDRKRRTGVYIPVAFNLRLIVLTFLIFIFHSNDEVPSYLILIVQLAYSLFILVGLSHLKTLDRIRSFGIEQGLLCILLMRVIERKVLHEAFDSRHGLFQAFAYIEYGIYLICIIFSIVALIYHICVEKDQERVVGDASKVNEVSNQTLTNQNVDNDISIVFNADKLSVDEIQSVSIEMDVADSNEMAVRKNKGHFKMRKRVKK